MKLCSGNIWANTLTFTAMYPFGFWYCGCSISAQILPPRKKKKKKKKQKNGDKDGKALYLLMNNVVYGKTLKSVRNIIDVKLVSNKEDYLKWISKPSYMSHKIFDNDLVAIGKNKIILMLNKLP